MLDKRQPIKIAIVMVTHDILQPENKVLILALDFLPLFDVMFSR